MYCSTGIYNMSGRRVVLGSAERFLTCQFIFFSLAIVRYGLVFVHWQAAILIFTHGQLLNEVEHVIENYQGLFENNVKYLPCLTTESILQPDKSHFIYSQTIFIFSGNFSKLPTGLGAWVRQGAIILCFGPNFGPKQGIIARWSRQQLK